MSIGKDRICDSNFSASEVLDVFESEEERFGEVEGITFKHIIGRNGQSVVIISPRRSEDAKLWSTGDNCLIRNVDTKEKCAELFALFMRAIVKRPYSLEHKKWDMNDPCG